MFYFAWVNAADTIFLDGYAREDEKVLSIQITHTEGEFPSATVEVRNPRVGLLAASRRQWAWLACDSGDTPGVVPLFFGRIIGVPSDLQGDTVTLEFLARPSDWDAQRATLAAAMQVTPYWDPVWFDEAGRANPDSVLEGYPRLWHTDRVTHVVTASDVLTGEAGTLNVGGNFFRDSLHVQYGTVPGRVIAVTGTVQWDQEAFGSVNLTTALLAAFRTIGGSSKARMATSFTGEGLMNSWPKKGDNIGAGWEVGLSNVVRVDGSLSAAGDQQVVQTSNGRIVSFPLWALAPLFYADYNVTRSRSETVTFTLATDCQALLTDPGSDDQLTLSTQSAEINLPIDPGGLMPIGDLSRRTYFQTPRGWDSIANLICQARAQLLLRSRAVYLTLDIPWEVGIGLSCRHNVFVQDARLPLGQAAGKVTNYVLSMNGDSGVRVCTVTVGCTIGHGNTVTDAAGDPLYVATGYVNDGYQSYTDRIVMPIAGEVTFTPPEGIPINDDGVNFNDMRAATVLVPIVGTDTEPDEPGIDIIFGEGPQRAILRRGGGDMAAVTNALNTAFTSVRVNLVPLTRGPFDQTYAVTVSELMCPQTIDLESGDGTGTGEGT